MNSLWHSFIVMMYETTSGDDKYPYPSGSVSVIRPKIE